MEWLNYHHLLYFFTVAREGSIARATQTLRLAQPTISSQIRLLEAELGEKLFQRAGRSLVLTEMGRMVYRYAEEIFGLGRELLDTVKGRPTGRPLRFAVGLSDSVVKPIAQRLLEPALGLGIPIRVSCIEDRSDRLLAALALHELDLVITDAPMGPAMNVRAFHHHLGECGVAVFGAPRLAARHRKGFPGSLEDAPLLLPTVAATLRRGIDAWLERRALRPRVVLECDDSALTMVFGQAGRGLFFAPTAIEREVTRQYGVRRVGAIPELSESFYAISVERRLKHPAVVAITETARAELFLERAPAP